MNVSHFYSTFFRGVVATLLLLLPLSGVAQTYKTIATVANTAVSDTIVFPGLQAFVVKNPSKGSVLPPQHIPNVGRRITYIPNPGFIGVDTFVLKLEFVNAFPFISYQAYRVTVHPSWLVSQPDFAVADVNGIAQISVLANDHSSAGGLVVSSVPVSNSGSVNILPGGLLSFTAYPNFQGIAHFNYVVCDAVGNCRTENVDVSVPGTSSPSADTLRFATAKNTQLRMPLPYSGYSVFQNPVRGTLQMPNPHSFIYKPFKDSVGTDEFVLMNVNQQDTTYSVVRVHILNTPSPNKIAIDDYIFTPVNQEVVFNVRENDINGTTGNAITVNGTLPLPPNFPGTLIHPFNGVNGQFKFIPNAGFSGIAEFKYFVGNSFPGGNHLESANVLIYVNNLAPAAATFKLTTPKATPVVINYNIPFVGYDFSIVDNGDNGTLEIYLGHQTITVNGQTITGYNLLVYTPNAGFVGTDEMEIQYCSPGNNQCYFIKIEVNVLNMNGTFCVDDCVWAGDANYDGVVSARDLLPIGFFMGLEGNPRPNGSLEWYGQFCDNWTNPFAGFPVNLKHADADGDGDITLADTAALHRFFEKSHNLYPEIPAKFKGDNGMKANMKLLSHAPGQPIQPGDHVEIEISFGTAAKPIPNLYGYVYKYVINSNFVISNLGMTFYDNSWLSLNSPSIGFAKRSGNNPNVLETAFTRTNGTPQSGFGRVSKLEFIVDDVIEGIKIGGQHQHIQITALGEDGINGSGQALEMGDTELTLPVKWKPSKSRAVEEYEFVADNQLLIFPNPSYDIATFHLNGDNEITELRIFNITGKEVWYSGTTLMKRAEVAVNTLPNGTYFAVANTTGGRVTKKFQVIR